LGLVTACITFFVIPFPVHKRLDTHSLGNEYQVSEHKYPGQAFEFSFFSRHRQYEYEFHEFNKFLVPLLMILVVYFGDIEQEMPR
jgi:hypothetical protein